MLLLGPHSNTVKYLYDEMHNQHMLLVWLLSTLVLLLFLIKNMIGYRLFEHFIRYTWLGLGWSPFSLQNCNNRLWHSRKVKWVRTKKGPKLLA